ncbi:NUDIX domain-containing protein [Streptococcus sp. X16XC17]|uniref:NUDIX hydrolase n=1 Tax=unclassified Streptococcus TaxID=2608887 RepID=UPI00066FD4E3|nr:MULTISPECIES: NUDIX domain-containing protein [unclassified Streptococcus]TCD46432.1 NUDIX domain-containing protein [Streptococcus sp. X16XC17]
MDYISYIRSKVGHDKIMINFAGGILYHDGKILLQKRADKKIWNLPGGAIELGESAVQACKREFLEETGLHVEPISLQNIYTMYEDSYPNGDRLQNITTIYVVQAEEIGDLTQFKNEETLELGFFTQEEIADLQLSQRHRDMIADFFAEPPPLER